MERYINELLVSYKEAESHFMEIFTDATGRQKFTALPMVCR